VSPLPLSFIDDAKVSKNSESAKHFWDFNTSLTHSLKNINTAKKVAEKFAYLEKIAYLCTR
jgi:hypothetical protein